MGNRSKIREIGSRTMKWSYVGLCIESKQARGLGVWRAFCVIYKVAVGKPLDSSTVSCKFR